MRGSRESRIRVYRLKKTTKKKQHTHRERQTTWRYHRDDACCTVIKSDHSQIWLCYLHTLGRLREKWLSLSPRDALFVANCFQSGRPSLRFEPRVYSSGCRIWMTRFSLVTTCEIKWSDCPKLIISRHLLTIREIRNNLFDRRQKFSNCS